MAVSVTDYNALIEAIRARIDELRISHANVEDISGLTVGHLGKTLGPGASKRFGLDALWLLLPALGLKLVLEPDMDAVRLMERRWEIRDELRRRAGMIRRRVSPELKSKMLSEIGRVGGTKPKRFRLSKKERSLIYRRNGKKGGRPRKAPTSIKSPSIASACPTHAAASPHGQRASQCQR